MSVIDNVLSLLEQKRLNQADLCRHLGINTSTMTNWKNRKTDPPAKYIIPICEFLQVTPYELLGGVSGEKTVKIDASSHPYGIVSEGSESDVQELVKLYSELNDIYKGMVLERTRTLSELERATKIEDSQNPKTIKKASKNEAKNTVVIDLYTLPASAGTGMMLDDSETEPIEIDADYLSDTKNYYAIRVSGDSMEPEFQDEDIVLVEAAPKVDEGEIGIFILNNEEGFIKKLGHGCLISLNPKYEPIELDDDDELLCRGRVLGVLDI